LTRRRGRLVDRPRSHERWLVSYADFVTLLLALFTVLYASSTVDARKMTSMVEAMQQVFSGTPPPMAGAAGLLPDAARRAVSNDAVVALAGRLRSDFDAEIASGRVAVDLDARGVVVSIRETGSFVTGSADLPPAAADIVRRLADRLRANRNALRVEGHTDDVPIDTQRYKSNWDLSTARATRVVAEFLAAGIAASRLSAAGYAEFHPRVANDSPENRGRNRRVDIVILNDATALAEEPRAQ
jgi:chemotaxis protein MotB